MSGGNKLERLRPIRVLVAARDRRFLRTAGMLLSRHGFDVTQVEWPSDLFERVRRERPNVVVLDSSDSLSATAKTAAALEALPRPVAALIVYEASERDPPRSLRMLPKWGAFDELVSEVERLYARGWSGEGSARQALP